MPVAPNSSPVAKASELADNAQDDEGKLDDAAQQKDAQQKAREISAWLSDHSKHRAHGRFVSREEAIEKGLKITSLEQDDVFQELLLSVFHTLMLQFGESDIPKIIENHRGGYFFSPSQTSEVAPGE